MQPARCAILTGLVAGMIFLVAAFSGAGPAASSTPRFDDVTKQAGVNGDDWPDIYFLSARDLQMARSRYAVMSPRGVRPKSPAPLP